MRRNVRIFACRSFFRARRCRKERPPLAAHGEFLCARAVLLPRAVRGGCRREPLAVRTSPTGAACLDTIEGADEQALRHATLECGNSASAMEGAPVRRSAQIASPDLPSAHEKVHQGIIGAIMPVSFADNRSADSTRTAEADVLGEPGENPGQGPLL